MKKMYKRYGTIRAQGEVYALLRPLPFEPEYTIPGTDAYFVAYETDIKRDGEFFQYSNPHVQYIKGCYLLDMEHGGTSDIAVYVEKEMEAEPPYTITLHGETSKFQYDKQYDEYIAHAQ